MRNAHARILAVTLAALALTAAPRAFAQHPTPEADMHAMFAQLGLTDDQKAQLKALHEKMFEQGHALHQAVRAAQKAFAEALPNETSDDALKRLHEQLAKAREAEMAHRFDGLLQVRKILNPEQRKKFAEVYIENHVKRAADAE